MLALTMAEGYGMVHWRFINLMNIQCELLIHPANKSMANALNAVPLWSQFDTNLLGYQAVTTAMISFIIVNNYAKREYCNMDILI